MLPWIRGWGADCEVVRPPELRGQIIRHVREMMKQYQLQTQQADISSEANTSHKLDSQSQNTKYTVVNEGPALADEVSLDMMELFNEFMETSDDEQ